MFRWARAGRRYGARLRAAFFLLLLLGCCAAVDAHIRPVIQSMAAYQAKVYATRILNEAVEAQLAGESPSYRELVSLSTGDDGKINAVQTDVVRLNLLKAALTNAATDRLEELEQQTVLVPLGTLLGWQVLSGRGPLVEFRLVPTSDHAAARCQYHCGSARVYHIDRGFHRLSPCRDSDRRHFARFLHSGSYRG